MRHIGEVGNKAYQQLMGLLQQNRVDLRTVNAQQFGDMLQQWTEQYMAGGDPANEKPYILAGIQRVRLPQLINNNSIRDYLTQAAEARARAKTEVGKQLPMQQQTQVKSSVPGLSLVKGASDPDDEIILRYNGKDFIIDEQSGRWINEQGQAVNSKFQSVFYKEAGTLAPDNNELKQGFMTYSNIQQPGVQQPSTQQQQPATRQPSPTVTPNGVQILNLASRNAVSGRQTPTRVRYKNQDYVLSDTGVWTNMINGKAIPQGLSDFLTDELP
jgi:hypothetical protein